LDERKGSEMQLGHLSGDAIVGGAGVGRRREKNVSTRWCNNQCLQSREERLQEFRRVRTGLENRVSGGYDAALEVGRVTV
jgi:hypothetical protein